jgi:hypothetical protein
MIHDVLYHIKLRNGEDLLSFKESSSDAYELVAPITVIVDPHVGLFAKSWLLLSECNSVTLKSDDVLFANKASARAREYYDEFMHKMHERTTVQHHEDDTEFNKELEDIFTAMMESKSVRKN